MEDFWESIGVSKKLRELGNHLPKEKFWPPYSCLTNLMPMQTLLFTLLGSFPMPMHYQGILVPLSPPSLPSPPYEVLL